MYFPFAKPVSYHGCYGLRVSQVFVLTYFFVVANYAGFVVSVSLASAFVGCAVSGTIADVVGRRRAFQISCIPMIFGAIIRYGHA